MIEALTMIKPLDMDAEPGAVAGSPLGAVSGQASARSFAEYLKDSLGEVNILQKTSDAAQQNLLVGNTKNIHETMIAVQKASISLQLMSTIRSKALDAYREVMRMSV